MKYYPNAMERLTEQFARLPGIGSKTAQRLAFFVLSQTEEEAMAFANAIVLVFQAGVQTAVIGVQCYAAQVSGQSLYAS